METSDFWAGAEVISEYSRKQAIEDGVLALLEDELADLAEEAGFRCPVALTASLFALVNPTQEEQDRYMQSIKGRLWDVLFMARIHSQKARQADVAGEGVDVFFPCLFVICGRRDFRNRNGRLFTGRREFKLWFSLGRGDEGEPVVTIGFPQDR